MFEKATQLKLRFDSPKGQLSVEDLWELPLTSKTGKVNLDDVAKDLYRQLKESTNTVSFVDESQKGDEILQLKFDIVKRVIEVKKAMAAAQYEARERAEKKQKIMALIEEKKNETLSQASIEELEAQLAALG